MKHLYTYIDPPSEKDLSEACRVLENGGVIAYPTDVNWALGCDAASSKALDQIRLLKPSHPKDLPFSLICSDISMVSRVANVDQRIFRMMRKALPGPYTLLLERNRSLPRQIRDKRKTVGVRIPDAPLILALVEKFGRPIVSTSIPPIVHSTYRSGRAGDEEREMDMLPLMGYEVFEAYGHGISLLLDLGEGVPDRLTTIIDLRELEPVLVRPGLGDPRLFGIEKEAV